MVLERIHERCVTYGGTVLFLFCHTLNPAPFSGPISGLKGSSHLSLGAHPTVVVQWVPHFKAEPVHREKSGLIAVFGHHGHVTC